MRALPAVFAIGQVIMAPAFFETTITVPEVGIYEVCADGEFPKGKLVSCQVFTFDQGSYLVEVEGYRVDRWTVHMVRK